LGVARIPFDILLKIRALRFDNRGKGNNESRSTSFGVPSALAIPRAVTMIGPTSPALESAISFTCEWYIQTTELTSPWVGPARSGTGQTYVCIAPGGTARLFSSPAPSWYTAPSESF